MIAFSHQWLFNNINNFSIPNGTKKKLWDFLRGTGLSPMANLFMIIAMETWGITSDDEWDYDTKVIHIELNNFSNSPSIFPWYYESENLEMFNDPLIMELSTWTSYPDEECYLIGSLSTLITLIFGEVLKLHRHESIGIQRLEVSMRLINNHLVFGDPIIKSD